MMFPQRRELAFSLVAILALSSPLLAQDTAGVGTIRGQVTDAAGARARDAAVCVQATSQCAVVDADGSFVLSVRPGTYALEIAAPGQPLVVTEDVQVRAGLDTIVEVVLPKLEGLRQTVVVTATAPSYVAPEEVKTSGFLIAPRDIAGSAGALQDVARYVQSLPGVVVGTNDFRNDLIVRGGSPLENLYVVDNIEIPNINSFATFASAGRRRHARASRRHARFVHRRVPGRARRARRAEGAPRERPAQARGCGSVGRGRSRSGRPPDGSV
jgi:hypothetical protein